MAIYGHEFKDPSNKRWAEQGVEAKFRELERIIEALRQEVAVLRKRGS